MNPTLKEDLKLLKKVISHERHKLRCKANYQKRKNISHSKFPIKNTPEHKAYKKYMREYYKKK